jgi:cysteine-rich repeat protein
MDKLYVYLVSAVLLVGAGAAVLECSGGAVCGNGVKEGDEQCDKGPMNGVAGSGCSSDCKLIGIPVASLQVSFDLLQMEAPGFLGSTCRDLGIDKWQLHLDGPSPVDEMLPCLQPSQPFGSVMPGMYQATITLLDKMGNPLTMAVKTATMNAQVGGQMALLYYNFKQSDFLRQDYTGALKFDPNGGAANATCATASVNMEGVTLTTPAGAPVAGMTDDGLKLDGTYGTCFVKSGSMPSQQVTGTLPWGHYNLTLTGKAAAGALAFCKKFDVFVGAGTATNVYELMVDAANADLGPCP